ncbi:unnamed protein product [Gongylonema pulchrum]|uniref:DUF4162 domain-containing protein n=1 Tax=Gongylonema pulchrum TaxID=637853 RepID=A0A183EB05_9BILA|nr:unnamed protein product [Gongylonema pulchrum]
MRREDDPRIEQVGVDNRDGRGVTLSMDLEGTERVDHLQKILKREDAILELNNPDNLMLIFKGLIRAYF